MNTPALICMILSLILWVIILACIFGPRIIYNHKLYKLRKEYTKSGIIKYD
jgi:hypothetical protein